MMTSRRYETQSERILCNEYKRPNPMDCIRNFSEVHQKNGLIVKGKQANFIDILFGH